MQLRSGWNRRVKAGVSFQKEGKVRNRRQKFLKVGQKFRSRRDKKRGLHDLEEELKKGEVGYKKSSDTKKKESRLRYLRKKRVGEHLQLCVYLQ